MATEVWFRNPKNYIRELIEAGSYNVAWDRGVLQKFSLDPHTWGNLYMPGLPWRALAIGIQGTMEIGPDNDERNPVGVYPTWAYGMPTAELEEMVQHPVGQSEAACFDTSVPPDERPVFGQRHMVVVAEGPPGGAQNATGRKFFRYLHEVQLDYPDCDIYLHNSYSFRYAFGLGFHASDIDPRLAAQKGNCILPSGQIVPYENVQNHPKWLAAVNMTVNDIAEPRMRCIYNIKSAMWAGEHYEELYSFRIRRSGETHTDVTTPTIAYRGDTTKKTRPGGGKPGDYIACDSCSLAKKCKYEREGAVCSVPDSEGASLANFFKTRNADMVIDGLQELMKMSADRLEEGRAEEEVIGLNPEVTKMINQLFGQGVQLAKLLDPNLRGAKVNVNVGVAGGEAAVAITDGNSKQLVAGVVRTLEAQGIPREKITPEMVQGIIEGMADQAAAQRAIQGTVLSEG